jgi:hypothetical protein
MYLDCMIVYTGLRVKCRRIVVTAAQVVFALKVHKHEVFFYTFFAETETIWSQGPVTRDI